MNRPWPNNQLKRLGHAIRDGVEPPSGLPPYADVMSWYNDLAAEVQLEIEGLDFEDAVGEPGSDGYRDAFKLRLELERSRPSDEWEIASLNSESLATIKKTHARYFEGAERVA